jgi:phosphatidylethanolamine/phosphatidyl-N-methylethanolamine N-methyltransferase
MSYTGSETARQTRLNTAARAYCEPLQFVADAAKRPLERKEFAESRTFLRALLANPRRVASLFPSSQVLARCIARQVDPTDSGTVLELGPGTGAVTRALLERGIHPDRLLLIEQDANLVRRLRGEFPGVAVENADAIEALYLLADVEGDISAIVSGLPLLNLGVALRRKLIETSLQRLALGTPFVQVSFAWTPPVREQAGWLVQCRGVVVRNFPPATVWTYTHAIDFVRKSRAAL